ncbi:MAG: DUF4249 domain-containing protein [Segetibacter sp.]
MKNRLITRYKNYFLLTGGKFFIKLPLRRSIRLHNFMAALVFCSFSFTSCEKNIDLKIDNYKPVLVVEAYINNEIPEYTYVVLSRSLEYFSTDFQSTGVSNAAVTITEGEVKNNRYVWNTSSKVELAEANFAGVPPSFRKGVYFDPRLVSNPPNALIGKPGKSYLLEISEGGNQYSAITTMLNPVPIDRITTGYSYVDESDSNKIKFRITNNYKDPDTVNNTQLYYYRYAENRNNFGWGGISRPRAVGSDELTNGQSIHLTHVRGFVVGDMVNYYMASVTRDVYNFWESFNKARDNGGPFSTPVVLTTNIKGDNVTGCFSGLSLSSKTIIIR